MRASKRWVRVLYMSKYTREELLNRGNELQEAQLLKKPFMPAQLLDPVRTVLAS